VEGSRLGRPSRCWSVQDGPKTGFWTQDENLPVFGLRAFIDDCLALEPSSYPYDLLTTDADVISSFIENLISRVSQPKRIADRNASETLEHAIRRLRRYFEMWKRGDLPFVHIREVPWVTLKPSGNSWPTIERYCYRLNKTRNHRYDDERIRFLYNLKPDEVCCGLGDYEGYLVFVFNARDTAVMERAKVGNAMFIVNADRWRFLSQRSKTELLTDYSSEVESFPHTGHIWRRWLRAALRRRGILPGDAPFK
jgi:hypothetical protein